MKKLFAIVVLGLLLSGNAYAKDKPKHFSCENSYGLFKIYLKYHFTDKTKYDVITKKFVKGSKKKIPTLELHKEETLVNLHTKKVVVIIMYLFSAHTG